MEFSSLKYRKKFTFNSFLGILLILMGTALSTLFLLQYFHVISYTKKENQDLVLVSFLFFSLYIFRALKKRNKEKFL